MSYPGHAGVKCVSGCARPCDHADCWQCVKLKGERAVTREGRALQDAVSVEAELSETTTITRVALKQLCERAGIEMEWNKGNPILRDTRTAVALGGPLNPDPFGLTAQENARLKARVSEEQAKIEAKAAGATDADIAAAEKLLASAPIEWAPLPKTMEQATAWLNGALPKISGLDVMGASYDEFGPGPGFDATVRHLITQKLEDSLRKNLSEPPFVPIVLKGTVAGS